MTASVRWDNNFIKYANIIKKEGKIINKLCFNI